MRLETRKYLFDIGHAADRIATLCAGKTFELYRADELLRAAVERKLGIIRRSWTIGRGQARGSSTRR